MKDKIMRGKIIFILAISLLMGSGLPTHGADHKFGWKPDRAWLKGAIPFENSRMRATPVREAVDLSALMIPDDDQGQWGRCTGYGLRRAFCAALMKSDKGVYPLSANYIYWREREMEGTLNEDAGAMIMDGILCLKRYGVCLARLLPDSASIFRKPSATAHKNALSHQVLHAYKVDNRNGQDLERAMSAGYVVVFGIYLRESFMDLNSRNYTYVPAGRLVGGHCMVFYKYDLRRNSISGYNQWGARWGRNDTFEMSLNIAHSSAVDDCWVIEIVEGRR